MSRDVTINATLSNNQQNHSIQNVGTVILLLVLFILLILNIRYRRRVEFTSDDDALLMKYIATYNPLLKGRLGTKLYERLVENVCAVLPVMLCN